MLTKGVINSSVSDVSIGLIFYVLHLTAQSVQPICKKKEKKILQNLQNLQKNEYDKLKSQKLVNSLVAATECSFAMAMHWI